MGKNRIAALGITNERVFHRDTAKVIMFLKGNDDENKNNARETEESVREKRHKARAILMNGVDPTDKVIETPIPHVWKIPEHEMTNAKHGNHLESADAGIKMLFPFPHDLIRHERVNGHAVTIYKAQEFNDTRFSLGKEEEYLALARDIVSLVKHRLILPKRKHVHRFIWGMFRGQRTVSRKKRAEGALITIDTPCYEFFHADIRGMDFCIGKPIEERFGLESLNVMHGLALHAFEGIGKDDPFYQKYSHHEVASREFTLRRFCDMVYDLVRIRHGYHC
ncbi:hypothetical protein HY839_03065 [Candidatus Azambacteria bacterium]|nr:hypothetical protein [Candidatus Azambacteria bacterium]